MEEAFKKEVPQNLAWCRVPSALRESNIHEHLAAFWRITWPSITIFISVAIAKHLPTYHIKVKVFLKALGCQEKKPKTDLSTCFTISASHILLKVSKNMSTLL